jgi:predicted ATPase
MFYLVRAELGTALEVAEEFQRLSERFPYTGLAMEVTYMHLGEFALSKEHFDKALLLYDPDRHRSDALRYAQNPGVAMRCHGAWTLWFLGQPDQALDRIKEAVAMARELSEPHTLAHALCFAAILHQLRREEQMAQSYAEAAIAVASEHRVILYQALSMIVRGWSLVGQGRHEEAIEQIRQGLVAHQMPGSELLRPHFLGLLAEALLKARKVGEGLHVLDEALAMVVRNGERYYQAELYRLKGELLLMQSAGRAVSIAARGGRSVVETEQLSAANAIGCLISPSRLPNSSRRSLWNCAQ